MNLKAQVEESVQGQMDQCRRLARVLTTTQQMLAHADEGEWERVAELEVTRRDDLAACFTGPASVADRDLVAEALAAVLNLNEELMSRLKTARAEVMASGIQLTRNRSAVNDYGAVLASR